MKKNHKKLAFEDMIAFLANKNRKMIKDISLDIYCPKTYMHHLRFTVWLPYYLFGQIKHGKIMSRIRESLSDLKIKKTANYVCGFNSKISQYKDCHILMLDLDTIDKRAEKELEKVGGFLLRSGRGYHFIGYKIINGRKKWERRLKELLYKPGLLKHVDKKHIYISINRGYSTLRITKSPIKPVKVKFLKMLGEE